MRNWRWPSVPMLATWVPIVCGLSPFPCLSQSTKAIVEPDRTTAEFEVPRLTLGDSGLWECRVSTSGGQDSRRFRVNVKGQ